MPVCCLESGPVPHAVGSPRGQWLSQMASPPVWRPTWTSRSEEEHDVYGMTQGTTPHAP